MSENKEKIAELYYRSGSVKFGQFTLSVHRDHPELPLSPWYLHYPIGREPGTELLPELYRRIGDEFYAMAELGKPPVKPLRIAGLPQGAWPLAVAYAKHYKNEYPNNLLIFNKNQHADGQTTFSQPEGTYEIGDNLQPCEDHVSGARNNLLFLKHTRSLGFVVTRLFAVIDRQQGGVANLKSEGVDMLPIFTGDDLLEYGVASNFITQARFDEVQQYRAENQYSLKGLSKPV